MGVVTDQQFDNLNDWTLYETNGTVAVSGGNALLTLNSSGTDQVGAVLTAFPFEAIVGTQIVTSQSIQQNSQPMTGINNSAVLDFNALGAVVKENPATGKWEFISYPATTVIGDPKPDAGLGLNEEHIMTYTLVDGGGGAIYINATIEGPNIVGVYDYGNSTNNVAGQTLYFFMSLASASGGGVDATTYFVTITQPDEGGSDSPGGSLLVLGKL